jgi:hypothetical protein
LYTNSLYAGFGLVFCTIRLNGECWLGQAPGFSGRKPTGKKQKEKKVPKKPPKKARNGPFLCI